VKNLQKLILLTSLIFFIIPSLNAQNTDEDNSGITRGIIEGADTIPLIELPEIRIYERKDYEYLYLKRRYRRLIRNVKKAYPYAKIAGVELKELDMQLAAIENEKEKKAYVETAEKEIMDQFEKKVKRLTITQGIILVKLIDRETGRTSYEVIKDLRGGITAFFWQGIARIFGNNLKSEYDPVDKDRIIEVIVQGIEAGFI